MKLNVITELRRVLKLEADSILNYIEKIDSVFEENYKYAVQLLNKSLKKKGRIIITGLGKSGKIAEKFVATLNSTGSPALFLHPTEALHGDLGCIQSQDVVVALSYSGNTAELLLAIDSIRNRQVKIIGIGRNARSQLAKKSDVWLTLSVEKEACPYNLAPTCSTTVMLAFTDAIAITLMQCHGFSAQSFARCHPAGALGKRLSIRVDDVMHSGVDLARVSPKDPIEKVIQITTQKSLGASVVLNEKDQLLGIITDGDLRRALSQKEKFFQLKALDVMSKNVIQILSGSLLEEGLTLMENRVTEISVLPVVDLENRCLGLVRLHDIVKVL